MANTYTQLHVQLIFAVQFRAALIHPTWKERLHQWVHDKLHKRTDFLRGVPCGSLCS
ncbi:MAG: hypothetical protein ICV79_24970 [Flavisolibacter sp.]|nr:hypothetical protein [Flavisolibacter sp.]